MAKGKKAREDGRKTDAKGRFVKGTKPGPGRRALPDWLKDTADFALEHLDHIVRGTEPVEDNLRMRALERALDLWYGPPGKTRVDEDIPTDPAAQIERLITILQEHARNDPFIALKLLAAFDPARFGPKAGTTEPEVAVDTVDFVPMVKDVT